jgi:hypothetical protein
MEKHQKNLTTIKKTVTKYWMISFIIGVILYIAYRFSIMDATADTRGFNSEILDILDIALNLGFSLLYLLAIMLCSFTIFLNLIKIIRSNVYLSWLSFSGAPLLLLIWLWINVWTDGYHTGSIMTKLMIFLLLYIGATTVLFFKFRKGNLAIG